MVPMVRTREQEIGKARGSFRHASSRLDIRHASRLDVSRAPVWLLLEPSRAHDEFVIGFSFK
jgi:hypothetical protein